MRSRYIGIYYVCRIVDIILLVDVVQRRVRYRYLAPNMKYLPTILMISRYNIKNDLKNFKKLIMKPK